MKKIALTIYATIITGISAFAAPSVSPDRDMEILREEIHRHELILATLKEKLFKLESEVVVERIKIEIDPDEFRFEGELVSETELKEKIEALHSDESVSIVADETAPMRKLTFVLEFLKENGIHDVALSASDPEQVGRGQ